MHVKNYFLTWKSLKTFIYYFHLNQGGFICIMNFYSGYKMPVFFKFSSRQIIRPDMLTLADILIC